MGFGVFRLYNCGMQIKNTWNCPIILYRNLCTCIIKFMLHYSTVKAFSPVVQYSVLFLQ